MTEQHFQRIMERLDKEFAAIRIQPLLRALIAHSKLTMQQIDKGIFHNKPYDSSLDKYHGTNLAHTINEWYAMYYPSQSTATKGFGRRPIVIRGEIFLVDLPLAWNVKKEIPAFKHVLGLSEQLLSILSDEEKIQIQQTFNAIFEQDNTLRLVMVRLKDYTWSNVNLALDLVERGYRDLYDAGEVFLTSDSSAIIWGLNQAVEKYLKAFLCLCDSSIDENRMKRRDFSHNIPSLLTKAAQYNPYFNKIIAQNVDLTENTSIRYHDMKASKKALLPKTNTAFWICYAVALIILLSKGKHNKLFDEPHE